MSNAAVDLMPRQYLMPPPPQEDTIDDFFAEIQPKLTEHYQRSKQGFQWLLRSAKNSLVYNQALEQVLKAIKDHLVDKQARLQNILNLTKPKPCTYYVYNVEDYRHILGDQLFDNFTQQLRGLDLVPKNQNLSSLFLEELLECRFTQAEEMLKQILLSSIAPNKIIPIEGIILLAQLIPILKLDKVKQSPKPLFNWEWLRYHFANFLQDDIFYAVLRSCRSDEQREALFVRYDDHTQIGKNRVLYETFLQAEGMVMNLDLLMADDRQKVATLARVLQLFRSRRLIDYRMQEANKNEFQQESNIARRGLVHLMVALIQKYRMETLRIRKSGYRRVLDLVQKYQAYYKRYPRAVLFFKDMKLIEWSYKRFGDLSYLSQDQRDDIGFAQYQTSLSTHLLAPTNIFQNQNAEPQQFDQINNCFQQEPCKQDEYQIICKDEDEQKGRISELKAYKQLSTPYTALITFMWYDSKGNLTNQVQGTGFLFSERVVITAKHNFYRKTGERIMCQNCRVKFRVSETETVIYQSQNSSDWFQSQDWDLGAIILNKAAQHFSSRIDFLSKPELESLKSGQKLLIGGYSLQYRKKGLEDKIKHLQIEFSGLNDQYCEYRGDTVNGLSGSPVFYKHEQGRFYVVAIHISRKSPTNHCRGILLSERMINQIVIWRELAYNEAINMGTEMSKHNKLMQRVLKVIKIKTQQIEDNTKKINELVLRNKKEANFKNLLETYSEKIISLRDDPSVFSQISMVVLRIGSRDDLCNLYFDAYKKHDVKLGLVELIRLRLVKQKSIEQLQERLNKEAAGAEDSTEEEEYEDIDQESHESVDKQVREQVFRYNAEKQRTQFRKIIELKRGSCKALSLQDYNNQLGVLSYLRKKSNGLTFIPRHQILEERSQYCVVQIQKGYDYTLWQKMVEKNKGLMAYLWIRDVCSMILELDSLKLYYFNFELRHIVLYDKEEKCDWSVLQPLISDERVRNGKLRFKLIDFSESVCFGDPTTRNHLEKLSSLLGGRRDNLKSYVQSKIQQLLKKVSGMDFAQRQRLLREEYRIRCKQFIKSSAQRLFMLDERGSHLSADATEVIDHDVRALIERGTIEEIKNGMNRKIQTSNCKTKI